jgi:hypothetical protein
LKDDIVFHLTDIGLLLSSSSLMGSCAISYTARPKSLRGEPEKAAAGAAGGPALGASRQNDDDDDDDDDGPGGGGGGGGGGPSLAAQS